VSATTRPAVSDEDHAAVWAIRERVFVVEQAVPVEIERDAHDATAIHLLVLVDDEPAGTGRLVVEEPGFGGLDATLGRVAHLGRIAVLARWRGQQLGVALVAALEEAARADALRIAFLSSQDHAIGFYERLGYEAFGPGYLDADIPHHSMSKNL
jgi:predicted GNAT family N-acyltransferase